MVWTDDYFGRIKFNGSPNNGRDWSGDTQLNSFPRETSGAEITVSGNAVYVVWADFRNKFDQIYFNRSLDKGKTWLPSDIRLDTGSHAEAIEAVIAASGDLAYVAWKDSRSGGYRDVYFNIAHAPVLPYGVGLAGSGGVVPKIGTDGVDPKIGNPFQIVVKDALGDAVCWIFMSLDRAEQPLLGGTLYGDFSTPGRYFGIYLTTSGPNLPGRGEAVLQFPMINDSSLLGQTFYWQGFVADPGSIAQVPVSHTGGLAISPIR